MFIILRFSFPLEQICKIASLGLMGMGADKTYGGSELDTLSTSLVVEELTRGCASTGIIVSIHNCLYVNLLNKLGTPEQKTKFLYPYTTSGKIGAFALSEPNAGSDVVAISTTANKSGNKWILNGRKSWVTSGIEADVGIIFATVDKSVKHKGITAFIVPFNIPGVSKGIKEKKMGIKATSTCDLVFENVEITDDHVIGQVGDGFKIAMEQLDQARIGVASQAIGISQAAFDTAIKYANERKAFGKSILSINTVKV